MIDNIKFIWDCLKSADHAQPVIVDFVLDNAGFEFYTDLIVADYLLNKQLAAKVRFHAKVAPWFVSDVTPADFHHTFEFLANHNSRYLSEQGRRWKQYVAEGLFELATVNYFWCSPYEYYKYVMYIIKLMIMNSVFIVIFRMREIDPELYKYLAEARLVIFKGDLNYRKLLGDINWNPTDAFVTCLRGFHPTNLCTLRTVKADLICGLEQGKFEELSLLNPKWMETGEYGVIQFMEGPQCGCCSDK